MCGVFASGLGLPGYEIRKVNPHPNLSPRDMSAENIHAVSIRMLNSSDKKNKYKYNIPLHYSQHS